MRKQDPELIIEQAVSVFTDINHRINSLFECSAKDFDTLNQVFRDYHSMIKMITEKAEQLYKGVTDLSDEQVDQNKTLLNIFQKYFKKAYTIAIETERQINNISNEISYTFLHVNNLKQNISTLRLLTTNIQLEPFYRKQYNELIEAINGISDCCQLFGKEFTQCEKQIKSALEILEKMKNQEFSMIFQSVNQMQKGLAELIIKKSICSNYDQIMSDLHSKKSISSSEIITNLQFQDIIHQKIEHVHHAHDELLTQLNNFYNKQKSVTKNKSELTLEIIFQVRNIGLLQAAQLVRANREYQKAVKIITAKFGDLDHVLDKSMQLLNVFLSSGESLDEYFYKEFEVKINIFKKDLEKFQGLSKSLSQIHEALFKGDESIFISEKNYNCTIGHLDSVVDKLKISVSDQESDIEKEDTIGQIIQTYNELKNNSHLLGEHLYKIRHELNDDLEVVLKDFFTNVEQAYSNSSLILDGINSLIPDELINLIRNQDHSVEKETYAGRFNVSHVKYYKVFEEEVDTIIEKLDSLISKIDFNEIEAKVSTESLERLKKIYTMKSERDVHEEFTGNKMYEGETENEIEIF